MGQAEHVLIVGAGEFGLSTALALLRRPAFSQSTITVLDSASSLPNPSGSSVDASRIIRADYAAKPYAVLASEAQVFWRDQSDGGWGGQGRYAETGFVLTADQNVEHYVRAAQQVVREVAALGYPLDPDKIENLKDKASIIRATGFEGCSGDSGYANWNSGWADAEKVVQYALDKLKSEGGDRVTVRTDAAVEKLIVDEGRCQGVLLADSQEPITADTIIVAAGAWTPSLIDLEGRCLATGQALTYLNITEQEQRDMETRPVIMNLSRGMFVIPPRGRELKIARHGYGYGNFQRVSFPDGTTKLVSVPRVGISVPEEGQQACRDALHELLPHMADRAWSNTRLCWYCDTPDGDFLIDRHPSVENLVLATGGSGHGFKFFPVIGEKVVDRLENTLAPTYADMWKWKDARADFTACEDGSRAGRRGMTLDEEMRISSWKLGT